MGIRTAFAPAARDLGHLTNEVAEIGPIWTDGVDRVVLAGNGSRGDEVGVVLNVDRVDPVRRSVGYRHERHTPGGVGDVVDEDSPAAEEARWPQDGEGRDGGAMVFIQVERLTRELEEWRQDVEGLDRDVRDRLDRILGLLTMGRDDW